jgi:hypothetical protein
MIGRLFVGSVLVLALSGTSPSAVLAQAKPDLHETKEMADCQEYMGRPSPRFRIALNGSSDRGLFLVFQGSIPPKDFDREKLIALACKLGKKYANAEMLIVWMFDCFECAKNYSPVEAVMKPKRHMKFGPMRGAYSFSREKKEIYHILRWWPDREDRDTVVTIDLGPPPPRPASKKGK